MPAQTGRAPLADGELSAGQVALRIGPIGSGTRSRSPLSSRALNPRRRGPHRVSSRLCRAGWFSERIQFCGDKLNSEKDIDVKSGGHCCEFNRSRADRKWLEAGIGLKPTTIGLAAASCTFLVPRLARGCQRPAAEACPDKLASLFTWPAKVMLASEMDKDG